MSNIIEVTGLKKSYGSVAAVKGIDFYVESGKIFAFLGPNGAGKSTTIDIICTFLRQDAGHVMVDGHILGRDDGAIRAAIGAVFQDNLLDGLLTVEENLKTRGGFYGLRGRALDDAAARAARITGITDILRRPYGKLSGGQRRRCDISRALVHMPKILFLDEPTTGLDPQTRKNVWETITALQKETGMTVFLTTHYMEEAAGADYVIIIDDGAIAAKGTPSELKERYTSDKLSLVCRDAAAVRSRLDAQQLRYEAVADQVVIPVPSTLAALPIVNQFTGLITGFEVTKGTMDDAFIAVTGKEIRE
ncbi:ABC transporter ATP-binding protein [Sporobacter termitidis]|uniref:ABC transporter ATP-binding protein n=1 Tax=Sporobacter termitidis TaxID=44749 RepID=UPI001160D095|nr:ABC transporter ATP-binding protein [Sporobacter termitidis]